MFLTVFLKMVLIFNSINNLMEIWLTRKVKLHSKVQKTKIVIR